MLNTCNFFKHEATFSSIKRQKLFRNSMQLQLFVCYSDIILKLKIKLLLNLVVELSTTKPIILMLIIPNFSLRLVYTDMTQYDIFSCIL